MYQFWQAERKDEVNASGDKITGETLPAVTQLFTEHYMVLFLLHNTIGAWWAARLKSEGRIPKSEWDKCQTEDDCRKLVALPRYEFTYLRFIQDGNGEWVPAAGGFPGWPKSFKNFKLLDPCCGSGHFLVAAFVLLVLLRIQDEKLSEKDACDAVLRENLYGLELDPRCTQIVERNYNMVELGPRGTGKSHLFQQVSPHAHLVSGGKTTVARMFVNMASGQRGLVCQYDVVCFDEISGVSFDQKDGVNIMKGYMESGEFSRGKENIRADGCIVMVGNFDVDVTHQQKIGHLFGPLPPEMRDDTAFQDRIHSFVAGWDIPKVSAQLFTDHFGLVSDFLSECWTHLRKQSRLTSLQGRLFFGGALSGRDTWATQKTINGLLKLLYPNPETPISDDALEWAVRLALECRRRVKEQQKRIGSAEFRNTHFSYTLGQDGVEKFVVTPELQSEDSIGSDPLPPGQIWAISPGGLDENPGLYRIEVTEGPGSGVRILNRPAPAPFSESVRYAEQNLYTRAHQLTGDRDPREHEFSVQLRAFDASKSGNSLGLAVLLALCSALLQKSTKGGLVVIGGLNLGGSIDPVHNAVSVAELAIEKGASTLLVPVSARKQLNDLPDDLITKVNILYCTDAREALLKAIIE